MASNPKLPTTVIDNGRRKHYVGIGWIDEGAATPDDYLKYPVVVDEEV